MSKVAQNLFKLISQLPKSSLTYRISRNYLQNSLFSLKPKDFSYNASNNFFSSSKKEDSSKQATEEKNKNSEENKKSPENKIDEESKKSVLDKLLEQEKTKDVEVKIKTLFQQKENELKEKTNSLTKLEKQIKSQEELIEENKKKITELRNNLSAQIEEVDLTRKRLEKEKNSIKDFAITKFAKDLLDIIDNLERAIETEKKDNPNNENTLFQGVNMTLGLFEKALSKNGMRKFLPLGEKFNPNLHEALFQIPQEKEESGIIGNVAQCGYMISDRVLRPAKVGVFKKIAGTTEENKKE